MASIAETTVEARLYEEHSDLVYRYCLRTLGSREDAEDATQTTFFQAVRAIRRGVVPAFEQAWLLTIAKNECRSRHRANGRRRQLELVHDPQTLAEVAEAPNGGDGRLMGVQAALMRLPEMQRRALLLREWQGRSYSEIATELGTTRPAVEALLFRARRSLARELGEETTARRALDVASLVAALKSALAGGTAVKIAAGVVAAATIGSVAGGAEQRPTRAPAQSPKVRVQPAVIPAAPETTKSGATTKPRRSVGRPTASRRAQVPTGAPGNRPGIRRPEQPGQPVASTPGSPAPKPGEPANSAPSPAAGAVTPPSLPAPSTPQPPSLPKVPGVELPPIELPKIELPKIELPKVEIPPVEIPGVEIPGVEVPKVEVPKVEVPKVEVPKVELPTVDVPKLLP
jgi:RNA polymerase sigma factor (sigma-70 family)